MDSLPLVQDAIAPLPTLPTEVVEEVIDQAGDNSASLRQLSLLCKSPPTRARYHLFTSIIIRDVQQIESSREFLDSHPWVPSLIQKVTLSIHLPYDYSKPNIPLLNIIRLHLFTRLPNLRAWRMSTSGSLPYLSYHLHPWLSFHHSTLLCYRIYGSCIQNLELTDIPIQDVSHFVRLISAFTSLHSLTCSDIYVRREHQTVLHDSEILNKLAKPLKIQDLSIDTSVDIRLVEYLLGSSVATLDSLAIAFSRTSVGGKDPETYFERLEEATHRLSELSSLTFVISCIGLWTDANHSQSAVQYIRSSTRILKHVGRARLRDVRVEFKLDTIASLGYSLSGGRSSLEACTALEESLLTFPGSKVQVHPPESSRHRAGRPEFWSPTITSAFPKLNERRSLTLPCTRPSDPLGHEMNVMCLVASPDSKWIVTGSGDGTIIVWDAERSTIEQQWLAFRGPVYALGLSPDSQRLVSAGGRRGETLAVWDISNGVSKVAVLASIDAEKLKGHETALVTCAWSPDGALIASACNDGTVRVWDALTFQQRGLLPVDDPEATNYLDSLQWSPDSRYLAWRCRISKGDGQSYDEWTIWSPLAEEPPKRILSHPTRPKVFFNYGLAFDPDSRRIATALGDMENGASEGVLGGDGSSDGHSGYVQVWDVASSTTLAVLGHTRGVHDVSFSPDGRSLLSVSEGGLMKIWDAESWQEMASLEGEGSKFPTACFSPDGKYIATTSNNNDTKTFVVRLWRVGEASCAAVFTEHKSNIYYLAFSPKGEFLASGDRRGIVHIRRLSSFI